MSPQRIVVKTIHLPPSDPSLPALALQVTQLVDSYLQGNLSRDWACAMPPRLGGSYSSDAVPATSLYRSSSSEVALPMAQRLAKRFRKQIFLSVDVPPAILSMSPSHKLLFAVEKGIVGALKDIEGQDSA
ncbi:Proteasome assembly chaperone 3 [Pleurotus pulmonarius]